MSSNLGSGNLRGFKGNQASFQALRALTKGIKLTEDFAYLRLPGSQSAGSRAKMSTSHYRLKTASTRPAVQVDSRHKIAALGVAVFGVSGVGLAVWASVVGLVGQADTSDLSALSLDFVCGLVVSCVAMCCKGTT